MKQHLTKFYIGLNFVYTIVVTMMFVNNLTLNNSLDVNKIFIFFVSFLCFVALTTIIVLLEYKLFYNRTYLICLYSTIGVLFPVFALFKISQAIKIAILVLIIGSLIVKTFITSYKKIRFEVNYIKFFPIIYLIILAVVITLNIITNLYIASIFLLIPILIVEIESYFILKNHENNSIFNAIISVFLIILVFFISYYSIIELRSNDDLNFLSSFLGPLISVILILFLTNLFKKKVDLIINIISVE